MTISQPNNELYHLSSTYDSAEYKKENDALNRWRFAEDIYYLADKTPSEWAVRIGVYGGWGGGKTTVLNYVASIARYHGNIVLWFNPWQYTSEIEMWNSFVDETYKELKSNKIKLNKKDILKYNADRAKNIISKYSKVIDESGNTINPAIGTATTILNSFISVVKARIPYLKEYLRGKRIFVLVDDLDRTDIKLVPKILYALNEILDIPSFTFILAFDPLIISKAFRHYYSEDEFGQDFLEKIIDYPRWIPVPEEKDLKEMFQREVKKSLNFIHFDRFQLIFPLLDKNPRKIKQLLRMFIGFEKELNRYNADELNWELLLLSNFFRINYPTLFLPIFTNEIITTAYLHELYFGLPHKSEDQAAGVEKEEPDHIREMKMIISKHHLTDREEEIILLIDKIFRYKKDYDYSYIVNYGMITDRPIVITTKEFNSIIKAYEDSGSKTALPDLINKFVTNTGNYTNEQRIYSFFIKCVEALNWLYNEAHKTNYYEYSLKYNILAHQVLSIIHEISFNYNGFAGNGCILDIESFMKLYELFRYWHGDNNDEKLKEIRDKELNIIKQIATETSLNTSQLIERYAPWEGGRGLDYNANTKAFIALIDKILENRLAQEIIGNISKPNWIIGLYDPSHRAYEYCLLRKESALWADENRNKLFMLFESNEMNVIENVCELILILGRLYLDNSSSGNIVYRDNSIIADNEIITKLWICTNRAKVNPHRKQIFDHIRGKIIEQMKYDLPEISI